MKNRLSDIFVSWIKYSTVDYPGLITSTVFVPGCNFNCAYCHNKDILKTDTQSYIDTELIFEYITKYTKMLDGLVISGGEPTLYTTQLLDIVTAFKEKFPYKMLKIDTNGSNPDLFKVFEGIIDYVAMDFKSVNYSLFSGVSMDTIRRSLRQIQRFPAFEVRTTLYPPYVSIDSLKEIAVILLSEGVTKLQIQRYNPVDNIKAYTKETADLFKEILTSAGLSVNVKGYL